MQWYWTIERNKHKGSQRTNPTKKKFNIWHVTCDMWHMTGDIWHVICDKPCDMWHVTHDRLGKVNLLLKVQLPSSYSLRVKVYWRYFHRPSLNPSNQSISDKGICRTSPATPGLLIIFTHNSYSAIIHLLDMLYWWLLDCGWTFVQLLIM